LKHALATRESFLAQMSHELRTPLAAVLGGVEAVREGVDGQVPTAMGRRLGMVERNGRHLLALIQDILDFTRGRAGKLPISPVPCRPRQILDQALELVGPQLADVGRKVVCSSEIGTRGRCWPIPSGFDRS
jgi:signal transduction histidine kinase